ncbi:MAG: hemin receptor [Prevotella sp.]|nr:hemin receptor [Prevotella sp.]
MKKYFVIAAMAFATLPMLAQETYENAKIAAEDLNGTARYVGMGGAMEALGADISTIGTNPAGIGLFRKSAATVSFGLVSQQDAVEFSDGNKTNMSFDQIGFVYAARNGRNSFLNFGFNYHKSRNFDYILSASDALQNASQNKLTYAKQKNGLLYPANDQGVPDFSQSYVNCNQLDDIYARNLNYSTDDNTWYYDEATAYALDRAHKGYVGEYDFNISGNINDRVYLGMTFGVHDVNYRHYGEYTEQLNGPWGNYTAVIADERKIDGSGFDIKLGAIFRPIETSPFRIGLSVATPTWYDLTTSNWTQAYSDGEAILNSPASESYDYKLYTPWKFGFSLGHTVGNYLALGASYEFADYAHLDSRNKTGGYYDYWYGEYYDESESDRTMNDHTKQTLKGVSTLKLGVEFKPDPAIAVRFGYNYVSPMYKDYGFKDGTLESNGSYYASATDYTNWKATNRITCGLGYAVGNFNLDLAYQYSATNGEFSPFMNYWDNVTEADDNVCNPVDVSNKRHQLLFTLGYKF